MLVCPNGMSRLFPCQRKMHTIGYRAEKPCSCSPFQTRHNWVRWEYKSRKLVHVTTALNISAGGALVAVRRSLPLSAQVSLEIPSAPLATAAALPKASRMVRARSVRITHAEGYHLIGLKFSHPLLNHTSARRPARRKVASSV